MGDLIYRQDAIRLAEQGQIQGFEWQFKKLCELPSAEPKRGKWIDDTYCSECGWINIVDSGFIGSVSHYNFCPNCGSYNGGENIYEFINNWNDHGAVTDNFKSNIRHSV